MCITWHPCDMWYTSHDIHVTWYTSHDVHVTDTHHDIHVTCDAHHMTSTWRDTHHMTSMWHHVTSHDIHVTCDTHHMTSMWRDIMWHHMTSMWHVMHITLLQKVTLPVCFQCRFNMQNQIVTARTHSNATWLSGMLNRLGTFHWQYMIKQWFSNDYIPLGLHA